MVVAVRADNLADWTFEGTTITNTTATDFSYGPADTGLQTGGSASGGHHASTATVWSGPAGNGSVQSMSVNHWGVGDYFQFSLSTLNYASLTISFDATGSSTGPTDFTLQYSTNGTTFSNFANYTVTLATWVTNGTPQTASNYSFDLSAVTSLDNISTAYFRLTDASTTSIGGGTVGTTGTSRVDNFIVSGASTVPEPSVLGLAGLGAAMLVGARRFYRRPRA